MSSAVPPGPPSPQIDPARPDRTEYRQQLLNSIGGWSGTVITAVPTVVFVLANTAVGLRGAVLAAIGAALLLAGYRFARHQSIQQAISGLAGVAIAALIAARTGEAKGYFLFGIWTSFASGAGFLATLLIRRPAVGVVWEFLDPTPSPTGVRWWHRRRLLWAYTIATLAAAAVFLARAFVQLALFREDSTGWLAVARIAMGYPLTIAAMGVAVLAVRRARAQLPDLTPDADPSPTQDQDLTPDAGSSQRVV